MKHLIATNGRPPITDTAFFSRRRFIQSVAVAGATLSLPTVVPSSATGANVPAPAAPRRGQVVAIYCPLWHRYDHMDAWHGYGWTEWELVKTAPPRFPGHHQPLHPLWGCFDESDPEWASREIALAADHNIDVFLFDWYCTPACGSWRKRWRRAS